MPTLVAWCAAVMAAASTAGTTTPPRGRAAVMAAASRMPAVYFSNAANLCNEINGLEYWIWVDSPDDATLTGLSVDVAFTYIDGIVPVVTAEDGVTLDDIDVSSNPYHMEVTWTARSLNHEPLVKLQYATNPHIGWVEPTNATFSDPAGDLPGWGIWSLTCCLDCFPCSVSILADDHSMAVIGDATTIPFQWRWNCYTYGGGPLTVSDTEGWVSDWAPEWVFDNETCSPCVVPIHGGYVVVTVPEGTAPGTTSTMTIDAMGSATVELMAVESTPVRSSTWGRVKALYR